MHRSPARGAAGAPALLVAGVVTAAVVAMLAAESRPPRISTNEQGIEVRGAIFSARARWADVQSVELVQELPGVGYRSNGFALGPSLRGRFRMRAGGEADLYVSRGRPPYVVIRTEGRPVFVNFDDPGRTTAWHDSLVVRLEEQKGR